MKATLEFNLPEESVEFYLASNATKLALEVSGIRERLRSWLKHGHEFKTPNEALIAVRNELTDAFNIADEE